MLDDMRDDDAAAPPRSSRSRRPARASVSVSVPKAALLSLLVLLALGTLSIEAGEAVLALEDRTGRPLSKNGSDDEPRRSLTARIGTGRAAKERGGSPRGSLGFRGWVAAVVSPSGIWLLPWGTSEQAVSRRWLGFG